MVVLYLSLTSINDYQSLVVGGETNPWCSCIRDVLLEASDLECCKDRGVVTGHDVRGAPVRRVDDAGARVGPPKDTVAV